VVVRVFTQPLLLLSFSALAFPIALGSIATASVFLPPIGRDSAFMTGFAAGHRNVGLMAAAQSSSLPDLTWLYFALVQLPIYLTPLLLRRTIGFQRQKSGIAEGKPLRAKDRRCSRQPRILAEADMSASDHERRFRAVRRVSAYPLTAAE